VASPIPEVPPVIKADWFASRMMFEPGSPNLPGTKITR